MPEEETLEQAVRLLRAFGDVERLRILVRLAAGEACVSELAAMEGEPLAAVSQRLRILRAEKLVIRRRNGKHINYALADRHVAELVETVLAHSREI
jgi:ArsR family transcriptional regulator, lead/cadmium/zinc/bismuth-responsive transcriptional repressor